MVTSDDENSKTYTLTVGRCNQLTTFEESKYENEPLKVLIYGEETIKLPKKEPINKSDKKHNSALIVHGASTPKKEPSKK